jgi:hypothetical protein
MMKKEEEAENVQQAHLLSFSMFLFFCVCDDDKKMERLFSSVPPKNIEKKALPIDN